MGDFQRDRGGLRAGGFEELTLTKHDLTSCSVVAIVHGSTQMRQRGGKQRTVCEAQPACMQGSWS